MIDVEVACVSSLANDLLSVDNPYANVADNGQFITRKADLGWSKVCKCFLLVGCMVL
jgi:hypothetical protein